MHGGPALALGPEPEECRYRQRPGMGLFSSDSPLPLLLPGPSSSQEVDDVKVVLVAGVFIQLLGRINPGPGNPGGPGSCPRRRILDGEFVVDRVGVDARKALGDAI